MANPLVPDNDPSDEERNRTGDSRFLPVVAAALVFLVLALLASYLLLISKGKKLIPGTNHPHPTSQVVQYRSSIAA